MKLTTKIDRPLQKIMSKTYWVILVVLLITLPVHYMLRTFIPKNYPDVFMQKKILFDQIDGIASILFVISLFVLLSFALFFRFLRLTEKTGEEKEDMRSSVNLNLIKKSAKPPSALRNKILSYLGEYGIQAKKIMEIYLKRIRGQKKSVNLNLIEKPVKPPSALRNKILSYLIVMLLCIAVLVGYVILPKFMRSMNREYGDLSAIIFFIIFIIIIGVRIKRWS